MHIYLEEAQLVVPQNIRPDEGRMYSAYEQIVRLGRNYGIGCSLITQRPQSVNKEVLSQIECLCVLQITGPHERKAIEYWVQEAGADRELVLQLPGLARGEGYVWSPSWLKLFERVHFNTKQTFDASATPEVGKKTRAASLSAVDVAALKTDIADVVAQAEKDDPTALRRKIAGLEKDLKEKGKPVMDPAAISGAIANAVAKREKELMAQFEEERSRYRFALTHASTTLHKIAELTSRPDVLKIIEEKVEVISVGVQMPDLKKGKVGQLAAVIPYRPLPVKNEPVQSEASTDGQITGPEQKVLNAIGWMENIGVKQPEKAIVAFLSGYAHLRSKGFTNPCSSLRSKGAIEYPSPGTIALTDLGRASADYGEEIHSNDDLHGMILERLDNPKRKILKPLLERYPEPMTNADLCAAAGYEHERSKGYTNPRSALRSFGIIDYPAPGIVRANDILFPL